MKGVVTIVGLLILTVIMPLSAAELPPVKELMVVGSGEILEGDVGKARQDAILNGLKEAVRISLLEFIPSFMLEENAIALDMEIFRRVTQYVQTFKILSETGKAEEHEVLLQVQIDLHKLRDSLSAMGLLEGKGVQEEALRIRMILTEVSRYPWYREFEDFLREDLDFIKGVRLRSVMTGEFTMDIELVGDIQSLLDALATKEFEGFFLEINQALEDQVMVLFRPRETSGS
ncbi:MAG: hypothetical protein JSW70_08355 [Syntrophobacterales bacterium]|nr:MAG: hypothetical protein JSW70_08355 [Syntrophobacterales bacterium]